MKRQRGKLRFSLKRRFDGESQMSARTATGLLSLHADEIQSCIFASYLLTIPLRYQTLGGVRQVQQLSLYNLTAQAFYFQVEWENSLTTGLTRMAGVLLHNPKQTDALCCATCPMKAADYKIFCT